MTFSFSAATMKWILARGEPHSMKEAPSPQQIEAAKRGNEVALAAIIVRFMPRIRQLARRAAAPGLDFDDAVQEGIIGLFSAIQHYTAGQGATFTTYAMVCIQNAIASAQKAAGRKKHRPLNQSVPLTPEQSVPGPEEQTIASEQVDITLQKARMVLSAMEKSVLLLYLGGYSHRQIAVRIGKSEKAVENALGRIRRKLR